MVRQHGGGLHFPGRHPAASRSPGASLERNPFQTHIQPKKRPLSTAVELRLVMVNRTWPRTFQTMYLPLLNRSAGFLVAARLAKRA